VTTIVHDDRQLKENQNDYFTKKVWPPGWMLTTVVVVVVVSLRLGY
jgi:hypothetical protein